jgi:hypothetical protein
MKMVRNALINRKILQPNDLINLLNVSDILQSPAIFSNNFEPVLTKLSEWESCVYHNLSVSEQDCTDYLKLSKNILKLLSLRFKPKKLGSQKKALKNNIFYDEDFYHEFIGENPHRNISHAITVIKKKMVEGRMKLRNYRQ